MSVFFFHISFTQIIFLKARNVFIYEFFEISLYKICSGKNFLKHMNTSQTKHS